MNILVIVKLVPEIDSQIKINNKKIEVVSEKYTINPLDEIAIEAALQIREKFGGEVKILTFSSLENIDSILRPALAMGADSAICIKADVDVELDNSSIATNIHNVVKNYNSEFILMGSQDTVENFIELPAMLAALLDWNFIIKVTKIELDSSLETKKMFRCTRETEIGEETYLLNYPCVISVNKGLNEPRYPKLPEIIKAKSKPITTLPAINTKKMTETISNSIFTNNKQKIVLTDSDEDIDKLAGILKTKIKN